MEQTNSTSSYPNMGCPAPGQPMFHGCERCWTSADDGFESAFPLADALHEVIDERVPVPHL